MEEGDAVLPKAGAGRLPTHCGEEKMRIFNRPHGVVRSFFSRSGRGGGVQSVPHETPVPQSVFCDASLGKSLRLQEMKSVKAKLNELEHLQKKLLTHPEELLSWQGVACLSPSDPFLKELLFHIELRILLLQARVREKGGVHEKGEKQLQNPHKKV